jgi:hypothetical protein
MSTVSECFLYVCHIVDKVSEQKQSENCTPAQEQVYIKQRLILT